MSNTPYQARVEHLWYAGHSFDIWYIEAGTKEERYAFSVDAATVCTGTLQDCKAAWIRESERVMRAHKPRRR
jgi:hypothetical protein